MKIILDAMGGDFAPKAPLLGAVEAAKLWNTPIVLVGREAEIRQAIDAAQKELGDAGRILVRASGTENLLRVMVEGKQQEQIERLANQIADVVKVVMS